MEKKRLTGVTILGVYLLLCAVPALFAAIIGGIPESQAKSPAQILLDMIMRILFISSPVVSIITGMGLLKLKNWARLMTIFLSPILSSVAIFMSGVILNVIIPDINPILNILMLCGIVIMSTIIIGYLTRPKVKEQFK